MEQCPLDGPCLDINIVYQAEVEKESDGHKEFYVGLTATPFKNRLAVHNKSFRDRDYNQTGLSRYIWQLKDKNEKYKIKYKIMARGKP